VPNFMSTIHRQSPLRRFLRAPSPARVVAMKTAPSSARQAPPPPTTHAQYEAAKSAIPARWQVQYEVIAHSAASQDSIPNVSSSNAPRTRQTAVEARLRILAARHESQWGLKELHQALTAGGVHQSEQATDKRGLQLQVIALAHQVVECRRAEDAAEAVEASQRELDAHRAELKASATMRFRLRGRDLLRAKSRTWAPVADDHQQQQHGTTHRSEEVSDDEDASADDDEIASQPSSYRAGFRSKGAAGRRPAPSSGLRDGQRTNLSETMAEVERMRRLQAFGALLVPPFCKDTVWADFVAKELVPAVGRCAGKCIV